MSRRLAPPLALLLALGTLLPGPAAADGRWRLDATGRVEVELLSDAGASEVRVALRDRTSLLMVDDATAALLEALGLRTGYSQVASWSGSEGPSLSCPSIGVDLLCHADAAGGWALVPEPGRAVLVARGAEAPGRRTIRVVPDTASLGYDVSLIAVGLALEVLVGGPVSVVAERAISLALELATEAIGAADALVHGDRTAAGRELASLAMRAWSVIVEHAPMWAAALGLSLAIDMVPPLAAIRLSIAAGKAVVALVVLAVALLDTLDGEGSEVTLAWSGGPVAEASGEPGQTAGQTARAYQGVFVSTGSMTDARGGATATLLQDGQVLVAGGTDGSRWLASAELYDPSSDTFTRSGSMIDARSGATATLLQDGRVLIAGGVFSAGPDDIWERLNSAELYDPRTERFTPTGSMTEARGSTTATLLQDGRVLIAGGETLETGSLATAELYDPRTETFTRIGSMSHARWATTATLLQGGQVLFAGGTDIHSLATAELYDPRTDTFEPTGSMTYARHDATAALLQDGRVIVVGGYLNPDRLESAELYDPQTESFTLTGSMADARDGATATLFPDGRLLIVGGMSGRYDNPVDLASAELYDPRTETFTLTGSMTDARGGATATLLQDGRVLIAGGWVYGGDSLPFAEVYQ